MTPGEREPEEDKTDSYGSRGGEGRGIFAGKTECTGGWIKNRVLGMKGACRHAGLWRLLPES